MGTDGYGNGYLKPLFRAWPGDEARLGQTELINRSGRKFIVNERKKYDLNRLYQLSYVNLRETVGDIQLPLVVSTKQLPSGLINFKAAMKKNRFEKFVHFYLDDGEFECVWRNPQRYVKRLSLFSGVLTPDFSLYTDMPTVVQAWNVYRSRILGRIFHQAGCKVIPTVSWSDSKSFLFAFDGIQRHSIVSISSVGIWRDKNFYQLFLKGLDAMIEKINPCCIVFYGKVPSYDFGPIIVKNYLPDTLWWKNKPRGVYYTE